MSLLQGSPSLASVVTPAGDLYTFYYDGQTRELKLAKTQFKVYETGFKTRSIPARTGGDIALSGSMSSSPLAACYWDNDVYLFYVDDQGILQDVSTHDGTNWVHGSLGYKNILMGSNSGLAAVGNPHARVMFTDGSGALIEVRWENKMWNMEPMHTS
ncbi:hypothetical protein F5Y16DRAFT_82302 [Xylariaceae sp. FL0255]|nr:hypothetical protein F5Y16DRAFT_82302 [Xylariaceae sp. FL0255]